MGDAASGHGDLFRYKAPKVLHNYEAGFAAALILRGTSFFPAEKAVSLR
jgi:hypothetical protein